MRQWEFTPTLLNGEPTAIIMSVTVNFQSELADETRVLVFSLTRLRRMQ